MREEWDAKEGEKKRVRTRYRRRCHRRRSRSRCSRRRRRRSARPKSEFQRNWMQLLIDASQAAASWSGKNNAGGLPTLLRRASLHLREVVLIGSIFYARKLIRSDLYSRILREAREFSSRRNTLKGSFSLSERRSNLAWTVIALRSDALYGIDAVLSKKNYESIVFTQYFRNFSSEEIYEGKLIKIYYGRVISTQLRIDARLANILSDNYKAHIIFVKINREEKSMFKKKQEYFKIKTF